MIFPWDCYFYKESKHDRLGFKEEILVSSGKSRLVCPCLVHPGLNLGELFLTDGTDITSGEAIFRDFLSLIA